MSITSFKAFFVSFVVGFLFLCGTALANDTIFIPKGSTSVIRQLFVKDTSSASGAIGKTGLVFNTAGLTCYYKRSSAASAVAISLVTATAGTFTSSGFVAVDGSNMPGWYEIGIPNAALISGADEVIISCQGATNMAPSYLRVYLTGTDLTSTAPNVNCAVVSDKSGFSLAGSQSFNTTGSVGSVTGAVGSVTAGVTVTTNNDKTNYRIAGTKATLDNLNDVSPSDVWNVVLENWPAARSAGKYLDRISHYTTNAMTFDPKSKKYSIKKDDGAVEYESGTSTITNRTPDN